MADMVADIVADMEVDMVADKVADMVADMSVGGRKKKPEKILSMELFPPNRKKLLSTLVPPKPHKKY